MSDYNRWEIILQGLEPFKRKHTKRRGSSPHRDHTTMKDILITNTPMQIGYLQTISEKEFRVYSIRADDQARIQFINISNLLGLKYCGNVRGNIFKLIYLIFLLSFSSRVIYFGDYNSKLCKLLVYTRARFGKISHYLADGANVCRFIQRNGQNQDFIKFYTYLYSSLKYDNRFEYKKFQLPNARVTLSPGVIDAAKIKDWILGTPDVVDGFISLENYIAKLKSIPNRKDLIYFAHRREDSENLEIISELFTIIRQDYSIEWLLGSISIDFYKNKKIYHFGSTAAITLASFLGTRKNILLIPYSHDEICESYWEDYQDNILLIDEELDILGRQHG